jgi:hypothetical protein
LLWFTILEKRQAECTEDFPNPSHNCRCHMTSRYKAFVGFFLSFCSFVSFFWLSSFSPFRPFYLSLRIVA